MIDKLLALAESFQKAAKKGRTEKAMKTQYKTMTKGKKHPFAEMAKKFKKHKEIKDPEGLAAALKDIGTGSKNWRKGPKK